MMVREGKFSSVTAQITLVTMTLPRKRVSRLSPRVRRGRPRSIGR